MRRPSEIGDFSQCIKYHQDRWWCWCVECDAWHTVALMASIAEIIFKQNRQIVFAERCGLSLVCSSCSEEFDYLVKDDPRRIRIYSDLMKRSGWSFIDVGKNVNA